MLDIGQIHRTEYELEYDRSITGGRRASKARRMSNQKFDGGPVVIAEAPGRIHLLGEHGDPAFGYFLSAAIDRYIKVAVNMRKDNSFRFYAPDLGERKRSTLVNLKFRREDRWANYLKTAVFVFYEMGVPMKGLNFSFCGDIPQQAGLASSTAIEAAAAAALRVLFHVQISDVNLARKLMETHARLFNETAALADYELCLMARKDQFMIIDVFADEIIKIKSPLSRFRFLLVDSRVPHIGAQREIASRKADTQKGLALLSQKHDGVCFKDFASVDLIESLGAFPEHIRRRSMHIVEEIRRVNDACDALQRSDIASLARIIYHSHESLRDLYEISCPEVDWLVKRAQEIEGAAGSRMTGQGFGGCTYTIIRKELVEEYKKRLEDYERIFGFKPAIYEVKLAAGAKVIPERRRAYAHIAD